MHGFHGSDATGCSYQMIVLNVCTYVCIYGKVFDAIYIYIYV